MKNERDILRWLDAEMDPQELEEFKKTEDYKNYSAIALYAQQLRAPLVDQNQSYDVFKRKMDRKEEPKVIPMRNSWISAAAAALVVLLISIYFLSGYGGTTIKTDFAQITNTELPDGSQVTLNAASRIDYNKNSWKENQRNVELTGEAFFKVTKGGDFKVETGIGVVRVLGTQFNVKARDNFFEVQCFEGKVSVSHNNQEIILTAGYKFQVINGQSNKQAGLESEQPLWMSKESHFDSIPLKYVLAELERQYNVTIDVSSIETSQLYTGGFKHDDLTRALQSVTVPLDLSFKVEGNKVKLYQNE